jgi:signal transduction histidine kinase
MVRSLRSRARGSWMRLPGRTARLRLTLLYAGMFLLLGTAVIMITYLLASSGSTIRVRRAVPVGALSVLAPNAPAVPPPPPGVTATGQVRGVRIAPSAIQFTVGRQHSADLQRLLAVSWLVLAVTALASALLGWFASGRVLRPLREMAATARTISAGNLGERLALAGPDDEFKQLGDTFDDLLARLEASFEAQRRFVANASHELRTPLTLERTLLQVALADPNAGAKALRATCEELLASGREHERMLEALFTLASSERGLDRREPLDLSSLARKTLLTPRPEIDRRSLQLAPALASAPTTGDPALIERLMANLIDNAVSYNDAGGRVEIRTATAAGHSLLSVTNTGPVVPPDELQRLFEPFQRLDGRRTAHADGHYGLGLSIVRAIATAHGATLTAHPQRNGGLVVTVSFPGSDRIASA